MSLIDEILEKAKKKTDCAEVYRIKSETAACAWNADKLKIAEAKETMGVALRVLIGGRLGFFATNKLDDAGRIVDTACEIAPFGFKFAGEFPKSYSPAQGSFFHKPTSATGVDKLIASGNSAIAKVKETKSDAMFEAKLERSAYDVEIANSFGARAEYAKTVFSGFFSGMVTKEGDVLNLYEYDEGEAFDNQPEAWAEALRRKFKDAETIVEIPSGEYSCIVAPKACDFLGPLRMALSARSVIKDMSPFKDKVGEMIFDERVQIFDDGLFKNMVGSRPIDDEGVTSQRTVLVENGVLKGFIHDLHTAKTMGVAPTGNGMRPGLSAAPRAGYSTLCLSPGSKKLSEMIKSIKKGVLIEQIMGAHQASPFSGDFSVSVDVGFVIDNGRIVGRFKNGMLSGNAFKMLKDQIIEIGSEPKYTGFLIPPVLYDRMSISTGK